MDASEQLNRLSRSDNLKILKTDVSFLCVWGGCEGRLAQLVERFIDVEEVTGSNPVSPTKTGLIEVV